MCQPRVSVIIPVYNAEKYLDRCIESAVNQTYENIEIILVDDGSVDSSPAICDEWAKKDERLKVIHKVNEGAGLARNSGLDVATGEYVVFIDSDDYIRTETVTKCVAASMGCDADIVLCARADVLPNGDISKKTVYTDKLYYRDSEVLEELFSSLCNHSKGFGLGVVGQMLKMKILKDEKIRFRSERVFLSEDAVFLTEYFSAVRSAKVIPEHLYMCVIHSDSLSNEIKNDFQKKNNLFLKMIMEISESNNYSEKVRNHLKARYLDYALVGAKQIASVKASVNEKRLLLKRLYKDETLMSVINSGALNLVSKASAIFWKLLKGKAFVLCLILLDLKAKK